MKPSDILSQLPPSMKTTAEYFKRLRDLFTLYEGASTLEGKDHYSKMIDLEIEMIRLDGQIDEAKKAREILKLV